MLHAAGVQHTRPHRIDGGALEIQSRAHTQVTAAFGHNSITSAAACTHACWAVPRWHDTGSRDALLRNSCGGEHMLAMVLDNFL